MDGKEHRFDSIPSDKYFGSSEAVFALNVLLQNCRGNKRHICLFRGVDTIWYVQHNKIMNIVKKSDIDIKSPFHQYCIL